ncbi:PorP/SprF family type IX secretion system membrane protein [Salegentibacter salegens]|uniref:Type IX secretion system membrane protein, PorP/SprF family n=1 Tax=Salegentibacter salegens TaxID=143223 RepID=A0A1M7HUH2_9FLAO|nr:type IX secretion system membrane protein PorP/SprF [Salegentibacter salegens]PRX40190.1 type IX secretion system PorP/SprF family membrane protein [Salegentibacter salegens]SHM32182.1 type IX secretion system membrane protein, PorP/SprF family [Salegentibacter salegens]
MKKTITKYLIFAVVILFSVKGMAQQDPLFTQYMYNMSVINPAYATDDPGMLNLGGIYRSQWQNVDGAPSTANFFAHTPVSERVELGLTVVHDEIGGIVKENNITADFAYVLPAGENSKISFGLKGGLTTFDANLSGLQVNQPGDPALENVNEVFPVFGLGAFWFGDNYYLGASAPNLFTSKYIENEQEIAALGEEAIHYYLTGGYVFQLNPDLKLKPAFMARGVQGAPLAVDVTANVLLYDRIEAGVGYRFNETITGLVNFKITPSLRVGYAYDHFTSEFANYNLGGTHEVMLLFDLDLFGLTKGYDKSPRFF